MKTCFFFSTRPNVYTLKIRRPLFFSCAPDRHWARNLFRLEFPSNSFQINFKFTSDLLANLLIFSSFFYKFVSACFEKPVAISICFKFASKAKKSALKWSEFADDLLNGIKQMCSWVWTIVSWKSSQRPSFEVEIFTFS